MRWLTKIGLCFALLCPAVIAAQDAEEKRDPITEAERRERVEKESAAAEGQRQTAHKKAVDLAVRRGVDWLARQQCVNCHFHVPQSAAIDAKGSKLYTGDGQGRFAIWDAATGKALGQRLQCVRDEEKKEAVTYLGVSLAAVPDVVRRHVAIPQEMGLLVETVDSGSPAQAAGVARYDVLVKIDEQYLVNPEQFSVLIRTYKPEAEVRLSAIQQNEPVELKARLARREVASAEQRKAADVLLEQAYFNRIATQPAGHGIAVVDLDGDGRLDLNVANPNVVAAAKETGPAAAPRKKTVAYLGVHTAAPSEALAKQLKLAAGTGLMIESVEENTAAAKGCLKAFDVLQKLDEQLLVNTEQFTVLIRARKPGDEVRLTLIREGKRRVVPIALGQIETEVSMSEYEREFSAQFTQVRPRQVWEWKQPRAAMARWINSYDAVVANQPATDVEFVRRAYLDLVGVLPQAKEVKAFVEDTRQDKRKRLADELLTRPEGISRASGSTAVKWSDSEHTLSLVSKDGSRHLQVLDSAGKTVFEGPVGTEVERQALPADIAKKLTLTLRLEAGREAQTAGPQDQLARVLPLVEWKELPLRRAFDQLRQETGANLVVNWKALKQAGINADEPISLSLKEVRLSTVLTTLLSLAGDDEARLGFSVEGEVILISVRAK